MKRFIFLFLFFTNILFAKKGYLTFCMGDHGLFKKRYQTLEVFLEYRKKKKFLYIFHPTLGVLTTLKKAVYFYGGVSCDIKIFKKFFLTPSFCAGIYIQNDGKNIGFPLEFKSGIQGGFIIKNIRIGSYLYHISNASLSTRNPGVEGLGGFISFPL